jgi:hypothetical protein
MIVCGKTEGLIDAKYLLKLGPVFGCPQALVGVYRYVALGGEVDNSPSGIPIIFVALEQVLPTSHWDQPFPVLPMPAMLEGFSVLVSVGQRYGVCNDLAIYYPEYAYLQISAHQRISWVTAPLINFTKRARGYVSGI